jgi:hypothetical protein
MQKHSLEALARELLGKAADGAAGRAAQTVCVVLLTVAKLP